MIGSIFFSHFSPKKKIYKIPFEMARTRNLIVIYAAIFLLCATNSVQAIPYGFIEKYICPDSPDIGFCLEAFGKDPKVLEADSLLLTEVRALEIGIDKILDTLSYIYLIRGDIADGIGQGRINACTENYKTAEKQYRTAVEQAKQEKLNEMLNSVQEAKNSMFECENIYKSNPIKPSPIEDYTEKALTMTEIVSIIYKIIMDG
ncbi:PREDICTED: uncharacterized protein LOC104801314 [Tarenaya hassleriana]|uniref:uncharacterized protein LOC104801314 n=1 Tax=Tarenaya hassleriana TaxID=28532 RepID=UPI00053C7D79|nr:PREDICTED: uncharacterized protein LOC104801314 [Tarenaya hassleriana]